VRARSNPLIDADRPEWNYGQYEGLITTQIQKTRPGWLIFRDDCPGSESPEQVAAHADRVIARAGAASGDVATVARGHVLRVLSPLDRSAASAKQQFLLHTGTLCVLGYYRDLPAIRVGTGPSSASASTWAPRRDEA
jgi:broad specificity phosphatase PhoE